MWRIMLNNTVINDLEFGYNVVQREIKYPRVELKTGNLLLVVPKGYKNPEQLIDEHKDWIYNKLSVIKESQKRSKEKSLNLERTDEELKEILLSFVEELSHDLNVKPNRITMRNMKSKWGSCSSRKNMNFNKLLKYLPDDLIKYVVLHELVHILEKKHDKHFWKIISDKFNDYEMKEKDLMDYWFLIQLEVNEIK